MPKQAKRFWHWVFPPAPHDPYPDVPAATESADPNLPADSEWERDCKWYRELKASKNDSDYDPIKEFADKKYVEVSAIHDLIDKKAEWVFGIAFASAGAMAAAVQSWKLSVLFCSPSFACLFLAMFWALRIRIPVAQTIPMTIKGALRRGKRTRSWKAVMIASVHCAATGIRHVIAWKSSQLKRAAYALTWAAILFFLLMLISHPFPVSEPKTSQSAQSDSAEQKAVERKWEWRWDWRTEVQPERQSAQGQKAP